MTKKRKRNSAERLQAELKRIQARQRRQFVNYDQIRRNPITGAIDYESVRTFATPHEGDPATLGPGPQASSHDAAAAPAAAPESPVVKNPANSNFVPDFVPEPPVNQENGTKIGPVEEPAGSAEVTAHVVAAQDVAGSGGLPSDAGSEPTETGISFHEAKNSGRNSAADGDPDSDPLAELLQRALSLASLRRGRPPAFDEHAKGQLVALLAVGVSLRQAASILGVSHSTIRRTLQADPALAEEITASRFKAQLQPLACVIREARRSWKAATWLLKYLDGKIAAHEETPDERRSREQRESDEFFARARKR